VCEKRERERKKRVRERERDWDVKNEMNKKFILRLSILHGISQFPVSHSK